MGGFSLLAIVNNAAVNMGIKIYQDAVCDSLGVYGLVGWCVGSILSVFRNYPAVFPQWLCHRFFPLAVHQGSKFSTSSLTFLIFSSFVSKVVTQVDFIYLSLMISDTVFYVPVGHSCVFGGEMSTQGYHSFCTQGNHWF